MRYFGRITVDPAQMGAMPCVRGLRITVATVLRLLAGGMGEQTIPSEYPDLQAEDTRVLAVRAASASERELPLRVSLRFLIDNALPPRLPAILVALDLKGAQW